MKKEKDEKITANGKKRKSTLTKAEEEECRIFVEHRLSCRMNQKQWAEAVGISYGLVKRIEARSIACSAKTRAKVQHFLNSCDIRPDTPDMHGLEDHILYDVFLTNMKQLSRKDAAECAGHCTRSLQHALSRAAGCSSPDARKKYFDFIDMFLTVLSISVDTAVDAANRNHDISGIKEDLAAFTNKKIHKASSPAEASRQEYSGGGTQMSLLDGGFLGQEK